VFFVKVQTMHSHGEAGVISQRISGSMIILPRLMGYIQNAVLYPYGK